MSAGTALGVDLADYCAETRNALAVELKVPAAAVDHNLDVLDREPVIWHELPDGGPDMVSAFRWDRHGWWWTTGPFDAARPERARWSLLPVAADCPAWQFGRVAAAVCRMHVRCRWCSRPIQLYGGIWFQRGGGGAGCPAAASTEHAPAGGIAPP